MLPRAADFPNPLVGIAPVLLEVLAELALKAPDIFFQGQPQAARHV